ncbi:MAG: right-handed parallel beta-helix repeat-containing protein [Thermoguttaceae bacterium]|nr:right-handed parallel beta-helix repeat-containing protein [Thermoguttaceae bacterium]MDW8036757.1 right-handed parallel beta-helix repeat-containing protein [Thermoguttaceae bacterium]
MKQWGFSLLLGIGVLLAIGYWAAGRGWESGLADPSLASSQHTPACSDSAKPAPAEQPLGPVLPGTIPVIEAARFPSLQAALDALPEQGGLVRLPPGRFPIYAPLILSRSNVRLEGAGPATCIINLNQEGKPALIIRPADLDKNPKARLWRVQLANLRICGDPEAKDAATTKPASGDGLLAHWVQELTLQNVWIDHCGGHGARLIYCEENPAIRHCSFSYNTQAGVQLEGCHDILVNACQFEENQDALRCLDGFNLTMTGNNIDDHRSNGVVIENTYGSVLSGNMIEECHGVGMILDRDCYGITISANVFAHNTGGGLEVRDGWGCAISANTFVLNPAFGLLVGPLSGRLTIVGNSFTDSFVGQRIYRQPSDNPARGILLQGAQDVLISGNTFSGLLEQAIHADALCRRIFVVANLALDCHRQTQGQGELLHLVPAQHHRQEANMLVPHEVLDQEKTSEEKQK